MLHFFILITWLTIPLVTNADDRFEKLQAVYNAFGIEPDRLAIDQISHLETTYQDFKNLLPYIDPKHELSHYASWNEDTFTLYQDRDSKRITDFTVNFERFTEEGNPLEFISSQNNPSQPLLGLRIALDPGHVGGTVWDVRSGKYEQDRKKQTVSEGVIALQTCLLLKHRLTQLGATVFITRNDTTPATSLSYEDFDLIPYALVQLEAQSDDDWFEELLRSAPLGQTLIQNFKHSSHVKKLYSEKYRNFYFFNRVDLQSRAEKIIDFKPHISLIIHFDGHEIFKLQKDQDIIRAYVPGGVLPGELASTHDRYLTIQHLLAPHRWVESRRLSAFLVQNLSKVLKVPLMMRPEDLHGIKVADGVYTRNLGLNRALTVGIQSYLEVFRYDHVSEFKRLLNQDRSIEVDGVSFSYSSRLDEVADGIVQGIMTYVDSKKHDM